MNLLPICYIICWFVVGTSIYTHIMWLDGYTITVRIILLNFLCGIGGPLLLFIYIDIYFKRIPQSTWDTVLFQPRKKK